eukprot:366243-Chlamydomonas_euryale.AAC.12
MRTLLRFGARIAIALLRLDDLYNDGFETKDVKMPGTTKCVECPHACHGNAMRCGAISAQTDPCVCE